MVKNETADKLKARLQRWESYSAQPGNSDRKNESDTVVEMRAIPSASAPIPTASYAQTTTPIAGDVYAADGSLLLAAEDNGKPIDGVSVRVALPPLPPPIALTDNRWPRSVGDLPRSRSHYGVYLLLAAVCLGIFFYMRTL